LRRVEAVGQVATTWQIKSHKPVVWLQNTGKSFEVSGRTRIRLNVDTPLRWIQAERLERARAAKIFDLVDDFRATVIACAGKALRVLIGRDRTEALQHGARRKVLTGNKFEAVDLALKLTLQQRGHLRIRLLERQIAAQ